jgi:uncharacterized surface protein with fasciclin (FAS1) repeats
MLLKNRFQLLLMAIFVVAAFAACTKKWEDHNQLNNPPSERNLFQTISGTPNLSKFRDLLVLSGYDKILNSSKTFTVWAPTDIALQSLDPDLVSDSAKAAVFVGNHITYQAHLPGSADQRIKMMNEKYISVSGSRFDSANIVAPNGNASNGILHTIDKYIPRTDNIWELINHNSSSAPRMRRFLLSLNRSVFDPSRATQTGVDPMTGLPVYDTASGLVFRNSFIDSVANVNDESMQYTMFLLDDNSYDTEFNKLSPWFKTSTTDSTNQLTGHWLVKDLVVKGAYGLAQLPDTLISQYGVKVPVNKQAIKASYRTSNGYVHLMSQVNFKLNDKFPPIIIQGENATAFATSDSRNTNNTFYRTRTNPFTGQVFQDLYMQNYNYASYWIRYLVKNLPSMRYNAYWVVVNDVQTTPLWQQRLAVDNITSVLSTLTVQYQNYNEVSLGQFTISNFRNLNLYVLGPTSASSSGGSNSISLDYIKLVPAF